jgi:hypothetical protein
MKKIILTLITVIFCAQAMAQKNPVDALFDKYSEKEGFTVVHISGKMLGMFSEQAENENSRNVMNNTKSIMILSEDGTGPYGNINFYDELKGKLDFSEYEELMVIKEGSDVTKMLVKYGSDENTIEEFLLISSGSGDNTLISIRGILYLKDLAGFSSSLGIPELEQLEQQ